MVRYLSGGDLVLRQKALIEKLNGFGLSEITVTYSGYGDGVQAQTIHPDVPVPSSVKDEIFQFAEDVQHDIHLGFKNDEGGSGALVIDVTTGGMTLTHHDYFEVYHHENFETRVDRVIKTGSRFLKESEHGDDGSAKKVAEVIRKLNDLGVQRVHALYSGAGSVADDVTFAFYRAHKEKIDVDIDEDEVSLVVYHILDTLVQDWDEGKGSHGEMDIGVVNGRIFARHVHHAIEMETSVTKIPDANKGLKHLANEALDGVRSLRSVRLRM